MFVINIIYKKDLVEIEKHVLAHRAFLDELYKQGHLLMSGPKDPRTGGVIVALGNDQEALEAMFADDPFLLNALADYHYVKFNPVKYRDEIMALVG